MPLLSWLGVQHRQDAMLAAQLQMEEDHLLAMWDAVRDLELPLAPLAPHGQVPMCSFLCHATFICH